MAANIPSHEQVSLSQVEAHAHEAEDNHFDYHERAQWLRAAVLEATDGLVSVASLMMGVGAVRKDFKAMLLPGIAGLVAGACSMAIGEFVSVYTQYDIAIDQMKREKKTKNSGDLEKEKLPNPVQAAFASALAFSVGGSVPLLGAAFIKERKMRLTLVVFGGIGAIEQSLGGLLW
jgi:VIT1/CCC1 family predicted Fe2+/Mn2+ transporter